MRELLAEVVEPLKKQLNNLQEKVTEKQPERLPRPSATASSQQDTWTFDDKHSVTHQLHARAEDEWLRSAPVPTGLHIREESASGADQLRARAEAESRQGYISAPDPTGPHIRGEALSNYTADAIDRSYSYKPE